MVKPDRKQRTAFRGVFGPNGPVLGGNNALRQGQANAKAIGRRVMSLIKSLKQVRQIIGRKARAGIL